MRVPSGDHEGSSSTSAPSSTTRDCPSASDIVRKRRRLPLDASSTVDPRSQPAGVCTGGSVTVSRFVPSAFATTHRRVEPDALGSWYIKVVPSGERPGDKPRAVAIVVTSPPDTATRRIVAGRLPQIGVERQTAPFRNARDRWIDAEIERLPVWRPANVREARGNRRCDHALGAAGHRRDDHALPHAGRIVARERDELAVGRNRRQARLLGGQLAFRAAGRAGRRNRAAAPRRTGRRDDRRPLYTRAPRRSATR